MSDLTQVDPQLIADACRENAAAVAETLGQCFDLTATLAFEEPVPLGNADWSSIENAAGVAVNLKIGEQFLAVILPAGLPLPEWFQTPDDSQSARLQTLGMEWSMSVFPEDLFCEEYVTHAVEHLPSAIELAEPADAAWCLPANAEVNGQASDAPLWLVWPVARAVGEAVTIPQTPDDSHDAGDSQQPGETVTTAPPAPRQGVPVSRLLDMPVTVSVRLAERKVDLKHLLNIAPGALLTFTKSCEELLDLYVNNERYCQGEAVKIGEKFGLKINAFVDRKPAE